MKTFPNADSQKHSQHTVLAVAVVLLLVAFVLAVFGIEIEADRKSELLRAGANILQDQMTLLQSESVVEFVFEGLVGNIHSLGGTLQCYALALTYIFTPLVVVVMLVSSACRAQRVNYVASVA